MRRSLSFIAIAAFLGMPLGAAQAQAPLTLECVQVGTTDQHGQHHLTEINYTAQTVHLYSINDDGEPIMQNGKEFFVNKTLPAKFTDNSISWVIPGEINTEYDSLSRNSGLLTAEMPDVMHSQSQCNPWTPPVRQRKF